ncbi:HAD family hydrolase [Clostridium botulinum]|uniref:HAD family hydrolase n=1 Tax=Clostridium botulinum TaxID=1491 RepID=UPI0021B02E83|nr:HAD family hydrolase [Clostridium botulinum]UZP04139.1 HAD family hydrolase [Clostridium botulinum]UZP07496.1 HAD family hydrolase [Clostridium botulinum]UZP10878.1 HAD family hydrolase [Clostridium botulinum]
MIKAVIFDLDDTLYNERDFVIESFKEVCRYLSAKHNLNYDELLYKTIEILEQQGRGEIFNVLCELYSLDENIDTLVDIYRDAKPSIKLYDDGEYILNMLSDKYKLGLITDGMAKVQWNKIDALDIKKCFQKIIVTDDYGREFWKPYKFAYDEMLQSFKCCANEAIYIGDNPNKDFIGAREVGLNTVRIIREHGDHMKTKLDKSFEADYIINDLKEVMNYLNKININK